MAGPGRLCLEAIGHIGEPLRFIASALGNDAVIKAERRRPVPGLVHLKATGGDIGYIQTLRIAARREEDVVAGVGIGGFGEGRIESNRG